MITPPYYPIVYVRGYAMTQTAIEETVATPYMGFNRGSTKLRQRWNGEIGRHIFESPLVRLMKDHKYRDVYEDGSELSPRKRVPPRSVWIYRYYEPASKDLGTGKRLEIEDYARGLHELIEQIRDHICGEEDPANPEVLAARRGFKVYLVAHSMGGLIVRCYLQKIWREQNSPPVPALPVDKVFTYATPHGGIDFRLVGNVPPFLTINNVDNFNEGRMREYLELPPHEPVNSLGGVFDPNRFFCLVGTNHRDYGLAKHAVGPMSDGLVQIKNASVDRTPRAFVHRSHSGDYGIVNSEEGYQNLRRFLFGETRVDGFLEISDLSLPIKVQRALTAGKKIRASYHIEVIVSVRGAQWDLQRRTAAEESAIFVSYERLLQQRPITLFSLFLLDGARVVKPRGGLGFSLELGVMVPDYEIDGFWFLDDHYEGGQIFREKINFELTVRGVEEPVLRYGFDRRTPNQARSKRGLTREFIDRSWYEFRLPIRTRSRPGINGSLILRLF